MGTVRGRGLTRSAAGHPGHGRETDRGPGEGKVSLLNHPRQGETMVTAAMMAYAYDQIDQARAN